ncbi:cell wall-binding repeat-containing protein [Clostridium sp.]
MNRRRGKIFVLCLTFSMLITTVAFQRVTSASTTLGGTDRYSTALKIVQAGWTSSNTAIIARGDDLADALAAAPLAYAKGKAPILLTKTDELPTGVLNELKTLGVKNIYIVGGIGAVSTEVENNLKEFTVKRISGKDRGETSYNVAIEAFPTAPTEVVLANGSAYADALSISAIAAAKGMPILLVSNNKLSASEASYISGKTVYAVGGTDVLNPIMANATKVTRLSGIDRYETNAAILAKFPQDYSKIYLAKGTNENLVDALTGSALAALGNNPIVLVDGYSKINSKISAVVKANIGNTSTEVLLGGTVAPAAAATVETMKPSPLEVVSIE